MAYNIISNRKNTSTVIHVHSSNNGFVVAGNSSVSNIATSDEVLTGAYITQAVWGCDPGGYIVLKRGANSVLVFDSTGQQDYAGCGLPITTDQTANIQVQFVGTSNACITFEVQKVGTFQSEYMQG